MSFGKNLQYLRKLSGKMTQEELASRLNVARQTISKWELDEAYPEIVKLEEICRMFNANANDLLFGDMNLSSELYSDIKIVILNSFKYLQYAVISTEPENDANEKMRRTADEMGISNPELIGWDFPVVSQEQINVYHMHGYVSALIIPDDKNVNNGANIMFKAKQKYVTLTITDPFSQPFAIIPNAFKLLSQFIETNQLSHPKKEHAFCFEKVYSKNNTTFMEIYIAIEDDFSIRGI